MGNTMLYDLTEFPHEIIVTSAYCSAATSSVERGFIQKLQDLVYQ